jgi:HPr kinase/phosphorylase
MESIQTSVTVEEVLRAEEKSLDLHLIAGDGGLNNEISTAELNRPGLAFAGFFEIFSHDRIQIIGNTETCYLKNLEREERLKRLRRIFEYPVPCFVITHGQEALSDFLELANKHNVPVMRTSCPTSRFSGLLSYYLEKKFAPSCSVHGVLLDIYGVGVLIIGKSGVGKSECALELIERGHRLVADDVVIIHKITKDILVGRSSNVLKYHMEIRGIGIVDVESLFGVGSVREEKKINMIIRLEKWEQDKDYERLGMEDNTYRIFDVDIPEYVIPVEPGRNLAILVEVAALSQRLKFMGVNLAERFNERLISEMQKARAGREKKSSDQGTKQCDQGVKAPDQVEKL